MEVNYENVPMSGKKSPEQAHRMIQDMRNKLKHNNIEDPNLKCCTEIHNKHYIDDIYSSIIDIV